MEEKTREISDFAQKDGLQASTKPVTICIRGVVMSFSGVPQWFFIIAVAFAICFILYAEWNSRK